MIKALLFDIGGVVLPHAEPHVLHDEKWEDLLNLDVGEIRRRIWNHENSSRAVMGKLSFKEFMVWIGEELGLTDDQLTDWNEDQWSLVRYDQDTRENVETYRSCMGDADCRGVLALSSGFMTYPQQIHPAYDGLRTEIATSASTFVLLPSLDLEMCVAETVRRQVARPFGGSREKEEAVIRERYSVYMAVPAPKVETMRPVDKVVDEILAALQVNKRLQPSTDFAGRFTAQSDKRT